MGQRERFERLRRLSNGPFPALTIRYARRYLIKYPDHGPAWLWLGIDLINLARYEEAQQALAKSIEFCPTDILRIPFANMGNIFRNSGDYDQATEWYRNAIEADSNHAYGRIFLGELLMNQGRLREAEEVLRAAACSIEGCVDEAYLNLGYVLRALERYEEAADCFREAIHLNPGYWAAKKALRDVVACIKWTQRRDETTPSQTSDMSMKERYARLERLWDRPFPASTVRYTRRFLDDYPDFAPAWIRLGDSLVELSRYKEAEEAFTKAIELFSPKLRIPCAHMGHVFQKAGDYDKAAEWYRKAVEANPDDNYGGIYLGCVLAKQGRLHDAMEAHRAAILCSKGCIDEAFLNLGLVLRALERYHDAADCLREAIRLDPEYRAAKRALRDVEACIKWTERRR